MVLFKLNPHVVIFFSLVVFLLLRQSISEHENAPYDPKDSKLSPSRKIDLFGQESNEEDKEKEQNEIENYDSSTYSKKMTKKEKESDKDEEKDEKKEKKEEDEKEKMKDKKEEEEDEKEKMKDTKEDEKEEEDEKEKMKDTKEEAKEKEKGKDDEDDKDKKKKKDKKKNAENEDEEDKKYFSSTSVSSSSTSFDSIESLLHLTNALKKNPTIPSKIKQGCKKADFPHECEATLISLGKDTKKIDPSGIFKTSAKALSQALKVVKTSVLDKDMGVSTKVASVCEEVYQDALETLKDGMEAAAKNDRYMAALKLSTVVTNVDTCQDGIGSGSKSKLAKLNVVLSKLAANTISLGDAAVHFYNDK